MAMMYGVLVGTAHLVTLASERRRAAAVVRQLRRALGARAAGRARSELRALKAELNPHFVGNALHTAAALVRRDPAAAERMFAALGALAEGVGARLDTQEVTLAEELADLDPFLALERARLGSAGGALQVVWDVPDALRGATVPHLLLQPLAENAVRHGLAPRGGGRLVVRARRAGDQLELSVLDDGVGPGADVGAARDHRAADGVAGGVGSGAGLGGVRRRLALLYGPRASCVLEPAPGGGSAARVLLPFRTRTPARQTAPALAAAD
jgi:LytS/YehU family sensor histidine kinase